MTPLDWFVIGTVVVLVLALCAVIVGGRIKRYLDGRYLREQQRKADERLAAFRRDMRRRRHAEGRAEFRETLRKEREEQS